MASAWLDATVSDGESIPSAHCSDRTHSAINGAILIAASHCRLAGTAMDEDTVSATKAIVQATVLHAPKIPFGIGGQRKRPLDAQIP